LRLLILPNPPGIVKIALGKQGESVLFYWIPAGVYTCESRYPEMRKKFFLIRLDPSLRRDRHPLTYHHLKAIFSMPFLER
jgi:hypothetical protein